MKMGRRELFGKLAASVSVGAVCGLVNHGFAVGQNLERDKKWLAKQFPGAPTETLERTAWSISKWESLKMVAAGTIGTFAAMLYPR